MSSISLAPTPCLPTCAGINNEGVIGFADALRTGSSYRPAISLCGNILHHFFFSLFFATRLKSAASSSQASENLDLRHRIWCKAGSVKVVALVALSFAAVGVYSIGVGYQKLVAEPTKPVSYEYLNLILEKPIQLKANTPPIGLEIGDDFGQIIDKLDPSNQTNESKLSASQCLHLLSALGLEANFSDHRFSSGLDLLGLLTNSRQAKEYFGHPVLLSTRFGVRPTNGTQFGLASQAHRDQLLCCFAQLGVPIDYPLVVEGQPRQFRDILRDSIANFHLLQEELEFTAIAYALCLPPNRAWTNKLGEIYTFDDLVEVIMRRELNGSHCLGAHLVEAMIYIHRVDSEVDPILSETWRGRLQQRLDKIATTILEGQADDGSWGPQWHYGLLSESARHRTPSDIEPVKRLLATGHITQCIALMSPERNPLNSSVLRRAVSWLNHTTAAVDREFIRTNFCPCCHAAWCLKQFSGAAKPAFVSAPQSPIVPNTHTESPIGSFQQ